MHDITSQLSRSTIRPVPLFFSREGFVFTQVFRKRNTAIYEKLKPGWIVPSFEVICIRVRPGHPLGRYADRLIEIYPSSEEWNTWGWTYPTLQEAEKRATKLLRKSAPPIDQDYEVETALIEVS